MNVFGEPYFDHFYLIKKILPKTITANKYTQQ